MPFLVIEPYLKSLVDFFGMESFRSYLGAFVIGSCSLVFVPPLILVMLIKRKYYSNKFYMFYSMFVLGFVTTMALFVSRHTNLSFRICLLIGSVLLTSFSVTFSTVMKFYDKMTSETFIGYIFMVLFGYMFQLNVVVYYLWNIIMNKKVGGDVKLD